MSRWDKPRFGEARFAEPRFQSRWGGEGRGSGQGNAGGSVPNYPAETLVTGVSPAAGSNGGSATYIIGGRPVWRDGTLTQFRCRSGASATLKLKIFRRSGKTYTMISEQSLSVVSGLNTFSVAGATLTGAAVLAGDVFGIYSATANFIQYNVVAPSLTEYYSTAGDVTTTFDVPTVDAPPSDGVQLQVEFTVSVPETSGYAAVGSVIYIGEPSPTTGTGNAGTSEAYFEDHAFLVPRRLETLQAYAGAGGSLMVFVLTPTAAGYSHRAFAVSLIAGLNNLVAGVDFPRDVVVPIGGMIGYWSLVGTSLRIDANTSRGQRKLDGTLAQGTYPTASLTGFAAASTMGLQVKAGFRSTQAMALSTDRLDYTFSAFIHPEFTATNWSIVGGVARSGSTGLDNAVIWRRGGDYDGTASVWATFSGATDKLAIFRKASANATDFGTVATINLTGNVLAIHALWNGSATLPAIHASKTSTLTFQVGREYKIDLIKAAGNLTLTVTDTVTLLTDSLTFACFDGVSTLTYAAGRAYGAPGFAALTGIIDVSRMVFAVPVARPKVMLFGDSITDGQGALDDSSHYAALVRTGVSGSALIAGFGGSISTYSLGEVETHIRQFEPEHVILMTGTNDTVVATWKANMDKLVELVAVTGSTLWLMAVLPEAADSNPEVEFNPYLRTNYPTLVISSDYAITTGRTGLGADLIAGDKFDTLHPNDAGHAAIYAEIQSGAPSIFA